ncbi:MAG: tRNA lysidine(34) synthetase TilS [Vicingaceae bacterium]|nr:tRNA lysidine(34) synthetase TilS [Vicingaceae bacterium]
MLEKFKTYYINNELFKQSDKVLLAVSGGKDSMAMLQLFIADKLDFGVAHCNFNLRGAESDADEQLVKSVCEKYSIPFYQNSFDTIKYAAENGISIQMAARDLRYNWFEELINENGYSFVATAHHKNDVAETMLINLIKGTGLSGLHGIKNKSGNIIRPLLDFTKEEIDVFIQENIIDFREDLSNFDNKYTRNGIRLDVIPLLEKINPNAIESLNQTASYLADLELILEEKINNELEKCSQIKEDKILINITQFKELSPLQTYLYYFIKDYDFNASDVQDIIASLGEQPGKKFFSKTHQIVKDREYLIITKLGIEKQETLVINSIEELSLYDFDAELYNLSKDFKIEPSSQYAYLDADKIQFPLIIRNWEEGDVFQPLGMRGKKKLSDFFIDNKMDVITKQKTKLLIQNNQIIWVVGFRIDDTFKITENTKKVLIIKC